MSASMRSVVDDIHHALDTLDITLHIRHGVEPVYDALAPTIEQWRRVSDMLSTSLNSNTSTSTGTCTVTDLNTPLAFPFPHLNTSPYASSSTTTATS
ncbi:hypothetical protein CVT24_012023 [Panaeolus cyanescens]|uniref:Uncharacterized protein n=1 Tax=Panaeolus cyanescens TaxID=181874 RepID=A0A409YNJ9_9AGAR|nr:hypothetical protein CVT24_012023 [Panaeolus cyanescens]